MPGLPRSWTDFEGYWTCNVLATQRLSFPDLAAALIEFDELASDAVVEGGARVVKLIGDSVMFVTGDPHAACEIALTLSSRLADHRRLPPA